MNWATYLPVAEFAHNMLIRPGSPWAMKSLQLTSFCIPGLSGPQTSPKRATASHSKAKRATASHSEAKRATASHSETKRGKASKSEVMQIQARQSKVKAHKAKTKRAKAKTKRSKTAHGEAQQWKAKANRACTQAELSWNTDQHRNGLAETKRRGAVKFRPKLKTA